MNQPIYDVTVPTLIRALNNLAGFLDKARSHAESEKIDPSALLTMRLYPDMFPLTKQVQIATDNAKGCVARLAQQEAPKFEDNESSFPELRARLEKTVGYIKSVDPRAFDGAGDRPVVLKFPHRTLNFHSGWEYLLAFALPNVYFHCTTAYDILRHGGVKIGKGDFLGAVG
jgi:uncharacterized protein